MKKRALDQSWLAALLLGANLAAFAIFAIQRLSMPTPKPPTRAMASLELASDANLNSSEPLQIVSYEETEPEIVVASVDTED